MNRSSTRRTSGEGQCNVTATTNARSPSCRCVIVLLAVLCVKYKIPVSRSVPFFCNCGQNLEIVAVASTGTVGRAVFSSEPAEQGRLASRLPHFPALTIGVSYCALWRARQAIYLSLAEQTWNKMHLYPLPACHWQSIVQCRVYVETCRRVQQTKYHIFFHSG